MGKPYSMDLRERAVVAALRGGLSRHESAARFGVAPSTVINWVRRFRETGSVAPGQMGGRKPKAIAGEHAVFLARRVGDGAFTLKVDYRSVWNFVHAAWGRSGSGASSTGRVAGRCQADRVRWRPRFFLKLSFSA